MNNIVAALKTKCPRCHQGDLFLKSNPYSFGNMLTMHEHCPNCGLRYERESGFFYGAMYISYAINIALFVTATVGYYLFLKPFVNWKWYILGYVGLSALLTPVIFRLSRSIWLMIMTKYDPEKRSAT